MWSVVRTRITHLAFAIWWIPGETLGEAEVDLKGKGNESNTLKGSH